MSTILVAPDSFKGTFSAVQVAADRGQGERHLAFVVAAPDGGAAGGGLAEPDALTAEQTVKGTAQSFAEAVEVELTGKLVHHLQKRPV